MGRRCMVMGSFRLIEASCTFGSTLFDMVSLKLCIAV